MKSMKIRSMETNLETIMNKCHVFDIYEYKSIHYKQKKKLSSTKHPHSKAVKTAEGDNVAN